MSAEYTRVRARMLAAMGLSLPAAITACPSTDAPRAQTATVVIPADVSDASAPPPPVTTSVIADAAVAPTATSDPDPQPTRVTYDAGPAVKTAWEVPLPGAVKGRYCPSPPSVACKSFAAPIAKYCVNGVACTPEEKRADALGCPASLNQPQSCSPAFTGGCDGSPFVGALDTTVTAIERHARPSACCYTAPPPVCVAPWMGRTLVDGERTLVPSVRGDGHAARARELAGMAAMEWASVASFARASMELMSLGAPAHLLTAVHEAAGDEIRHATWLLDAAHAITGERPTLGAVEPVTPREMTFAELARTTFVEACAPETLGAIRAREEAHRETDGPLQKALLRIADDEERHAELAWKILAWALERGGEPARHALAEVAKSAQPSEMIDAWNAVVAPCLDQAMRSVLGASSPSSASAAMNARALG